MVKSQGDRPDPPRLAGRIIFAALLTLVVFGLYVASYGIIALVPVAMAIIGAGMALQLPPWIVVLAIAGSISLMKRCASLLGVGFGLRERVVSA